METIIDTLKIYERLKEAELPDKAAREIAEVIKDTIEARLVTKEYLDIRLKELELRLTVRLGTIVAAGIAIIAAIVKLL